MDGYVIICTAAPDRFTAAHVKHDDLLNVSSLQMKDIEFHENNTRGMPKSRGAYKLVESSPLDQPLTAEYGSFSH